MSVSRTCPSNGSSSEGCVPLQRRLGVEEMVSVIMLHLWRASPLGGFVFPVSAKALNSLHADGQLGGEHAQVRTDLAVENLPKLEIVEYC